MKSKILTVVGYFDPVDVLRKSRKFCYSEIVAVGPAKGPKKEPKKADEKKKDHIVIDVSVCTSAITS